MDVASISEQKQLGEVVEDHADTVVVEAVAEAVLVAVVHPLADPDQGLGPRVLRLVLEVRRLLPGLAGDQGLELGVEVGEVAVLRPSLGLGAVLPAHGAEAAAGLVVNLHQRSSARDQTRVVLGVEPRTFSVKLAVY